MRGFHARTGLLFGALAVSLGYGGVGGDADAARLEGSVHASQLEEAALDLSVVQSAALSAKALDRASLETDLVSDCELSASPLYEASVETEQIEEAEAGAGALAVAGATVDPSTEED